MTPAIQHPTPYLADVDGKKPSMRIVWLLILADLLTGLLYNLGSEFYRVGLPVKSVIILVAFFYYISLVKAKSFMSIYLTMGILTTFWLLGTFTSYLHNPEFSYSYSLVVLNRYLFFFILACIFINRAQHGQFYRACADTFERFLTINNTLILVGLVFRIDMFSTYDPLGEIQAGEQRFGYKGLIHGGNDIAGIYILGIAHMYRENFKYNARKKIALFITCLAALLTGTKAGLLAVAGISLYYWAAYYPRFVSFVFATGLVAAIFWLGLQWLSVYTTYIQPFQKHLASMDVLSYLMSSRNEFVVNNFNFMSTQWTWMNFITGDAFLYSETDILDLYYFFGIGMFLYLYMYGRIFFIRDNSRDNIYVFIALVAIASTAGHIMQSTVVPIFLLLYTFAARTPDHYDTIRNNSNR